MIADELRDRLAVRIGHAVEYAEPPTELVGGFYTRNYRFSLRNGSPGWSGPMVLRLFPNHAPAELDEWEAAVQRFAHDRGVPAPGIVLDERGSTIDGRRWFVMELLPGSAAMEGISARQLVGGFRRMVRDLTAPDRGGSPRAAPPRPEPARRVVRRNGDRGAVVGPHRPTR